VPEEGGAEALSFVLGVNPIRPSRIAGNSSGWLRPNFFGADDRRTDAVDEAIETNDALRLDLYDHPRPARATGLVAQRMAD